MESNANIVLVGFMGTGKTSTGRAIAQALRRDFIDMDEELVRRQGRSIAEIFTTDGEAHFRKLERDLVQELAAKTNLVIAPGGGIVLNPANIADFEKTGFVFCLRATPEMILSRVGHDTGRPLLQGGDKLQKITDLLAKRKPLYDAVKRQVDTDGLTPEDVAVRILRLVAETR